MSESRPIWEQQGTSKRVAVQAMFADIAPVYDRLNGILSFQNHVRWRTIAAKGLNLKSGDSALDVCTGTGDFLPILRRLVGPSGKVSGLDFCLPMLEGAQTKQPNPIGLGDACCLPVQSASVDGVTVGWGIRNVPDIDLAHRELFRVLKPGGRFVSVDMAQPTNPILKAISTFVYHTVTPKLGALFGKASAYTYLPKSTQTFLNREQLADSMRRAGFTNVTTRDLMLGNICIHWGTKP